MDTKKHTGAPAVMSSYQPPVVRGTGGLEGAQRTSRETMMWTPPMDIGADTMVNPHKPLADARGLDLAINDGYIAGAMHTNRDSIVGSQYMVNSQVDFEMIKELLEVNKPEWAKDVKITRAWCEKFQAHVERLFNLTSNAPTNWLDASRRNNFTMMLRLGIATHLMKGEVLATVEWIRQDDRPFNTAIQMVDPSRLSNPDLQMDTATLRAGVEIDPNWGAPVAYWIRDGYAQDIYNNDYKWKRVPAVKPWGRKQVIHIMEQFAIDQSRGVSELVAAMKEVRMAKKFRDVTLQSAILNATYAAALETELPREMVTTMMGAPGSAGEAVTETVGAWMTGLNEFHRGRGDIILDGVKVPIFYPGTKLNTKALGTPGGVGTSFEESLSRNIASTLGLSYEQFSRDFSKTNYSSARASMGETQKRMDAKKKVIADSLASEIYSVWMEEQINKGQLPLPDGCDAMTFSSMFYLPMMKEALTCCSWIGASRGQIDELKETQAAILRINSGLSTREKESARLGEDYRYILQQAAREKKLTEKLGLDFDGGAEKPGSNQRQQLMRSGGNDSGQDDSDKQDKEEDKGNDE